MSGCQLQVKQIENNVRSQNKYLNLKANHTHVFQQMRISSGSNGFTESENGHLLQRILPLKMFSLFLNWVSKTLNITSNFCFFPLYFSGADVGGVLGCGSIDVCRGRVQYDSWERVGCLLNWTLEYGSRGLGVLGRWRV